MTSESYTPQARWGAFAGTIFTVLGVVNILFGISILADSDWIVFTPNGAWLLDFTAWGWIILIVGIIQLVVGWGVFSGANWARITGLVLAVLSAVSALLSTGINSTWGLAAFALTILVIFGLTAAPDEGELS
jgi:hypothetical protein